MNQFYVDGKPQCVPIKEITITPCKYHGRTVGIDKITSTINQIHAQKILSEITNQNTVFTNHKPLQAVNIVFNGPATIVFWSDHTKTVVKCSECANSEICDGMADCDLASKEYGIAMAFAKKGFGKYFFQALKEYGQ